MRPEGIVDENADTDIEEQTYAVIDKYTEFSTIKLLRHETGEVEEMDMEEYLLRCGSK